MCLLIHQQPFEKDSCILVVASLCISYEEVMDLILQWEYQREPELGWYVFRTYAYNFICLWECQTEMWSVCIHIGAVLFTVWTSAANQVQRLSQFCRFPEFLFVTRGCDSVNCPENIWSYSSFYYLGDYNAALTKN